MAKKMENMPEEKKAIIEEFKAQKPENKMDWTLEDW